MKHEVVNRMEEVNSRDYEELDMQQIENKLIESW
jgi:hypothetical protein